MAKRLNKKNLLVIVSAGILVGVEVLCAALAAGWAAGGLFQLGREVTIGLIVICMAAGLWATVKFVQSALKVEPIFE